MTTAWALFSRLRQLSTVWQVSPSKPEPPWVLSQHSFISSWKPQVITWLCLLSFLDWRPAPLSLIKQRGKVLTRAPNSLFFSLLCTFIPCLKHPGVHPGRNAVGFSRSCRRARVHFLFTPSLTHSLTHFSQYVFFSPLCTRSYVRYLGFSWGQNWRDSCPRGASGLSERQTWIKYLHKFRNVNNAEFCDQKL